MLLDIQHLDVDFENDEGRFTRAVRDVSLSLDRGEVLAIAGESGSGKSTVAMSVPRLLPSPPARWANGQVLFDGKNTLAMSPEELRSIRGSRIGVVFQDPMGSLSPIHRIVDQLMETILLHVKMSKRAAREMSIEWLGKVGIPEPETRAMAYPHELSGGMQQRVMIAMALMLDPDLLIADEPTTALDVTVQAQVLRLMKKLHQAKSAVLLITHDMGVVYQMATKIAVMKSGEVVERSDDPEEFFRSPKHPYSKKLLDAVLV